MCEKLLSSRRGQNTFKRNCLKIIFAVLLSLAFLERPHLENPVIGQCEMHLDICLGAFVYGIFVLLFCFCVFVFCLRLYAPVSERVSVCREVKIEFHNITTLLVS